METLQQYFTKQIENHTEVKFNIFSALHNVNDEVRLHSRFIAYLLNSDSHHGMGNKFLKLFVQTVLEINDFDCENCTVQTEYKDIDILIYNDEQAIIIENKIFAGDSNHLHKEDEYRGQLERYFNTIKKGIDKDGKKSTKREEVFMTYLTLDGRFPSETSRGNTLTIDEIICIDYTEKISKWLLDCISIVEEKNYLLAKNIHQYQELIIELTSDVNQAKENQMMISENIDEAWELEKKDHFFTEECKDVFKHVKWHTVADFINELDSELIKKGAEIIEKPSLDAITNVTHQSNNKSTTKIVISFKYNDADLYIANDKVNGFTLGNLNIRKWDYFSDDIKDIRFSDFSEERTFKMINYKKRKEVINKIVKFVDENYLKVNKTFPSK